MSYIVIIGQVTQTDKNTIDEQTDGKSILLNLCITQWFMDNVYVREILIIFPLKQTYLFSFDTKVELTLHTIYSSNLTSIDYIPI